MKLYKTLVMPVLMYGCETWKMTKSDERVLNMFENKCLQKIHGIRWQDHVTTKELLARAEMSPVSQEVKRRRWKFIGHILRQDRVSDTRTALSWRQRGVKPKTMWRRRPYVPPGTQRIGDSFLHSHWKRKKISQGHQRKE